MTTYIIIAMVVGWLCSGALSFIYWYTKDFDFTKGDIFPCACISVMGPITFIMGWIIHGLDNDDKILIKKRKKQ